MKSRICCFIAIFVGTLAFCVLASPVSTTAEPTTSNATTTQENINCSNPNFRTYIHCLKRQKRHHYHSDDSNHGEYDEICKTSCMKKCEYERPIRDCHDHCSYCLRKTKHKQQVITETEYVTEPEKTVVCKNNTDCEVPVKDGKAFNVTVIVDVNTSSANGSTGVVYPPIPPFPPYPPFPPFPPFPPYPPYPEFPPWPPWPPYPQMHTSHCESCHQRPPIPWTYIPSRPRPRGYDCSVCMYPQTYYLCSIPCMQYQPVHQPVHQPCVSPPCVHQPIHQPCVNPPCVHQPVHQPCLTPDCVGGVVPY